MVDSYFSFFPANVPVDMLMHSISDKGTRSERIKCATAMAAGLCANIPPSMNPLDAGVSFCVRTRVPSDDCGTSIIVAMSACVYDKPWLLREFHAVLNGVYDFCLLKRVTGTVAKEEQEMLAQEARRVGEQATKIAKEEAERRSKESAERKLKEDAERKAAHLAALKAKEETERMACAICHAQLQAGGSHARAPACTECGRTSLCMACVKNALLSSRGEKEKRPVCVQCLDKIAKQRSEPPRAEPQSAHDGLSLFLFGVVVVVAAASLGYAVIRTRREGNHE